MEDQKKCWQKPVLIVIGRGAPEENVLAACKVRGANGAGGPDCEQADGSGACQAQGNS